MVIFACPVPVIMHGFIHMNGRIYDPRLGRMLSPDLVTQAPENGQNYNRYSYAYNNPLKYSDPSGFVICELTCQFVVSSVIASVTDAFGFGSNGCDRTCKERKAAHNWCKAQSACLAELRANTREKFRKRSAQVILEATLTGQSYYYENGRAYLGDQTTEIGAPVAEITVVDVANGIGSYVAGILGTFDYTLRREGFYGQEDQQRARVEGQVFNEIIGDLFTNEEFREWAVERAKDYAANNPGKVAGRVLVMTATDVALGRIGPSGVVLAGALNLAAVNGNVRIAIKKGASTAEEVLKSIVVGE